MKIAYLHFGGVFTDEQPCTRLTIETEVKENYTWWQKRGLMFTATGYGGRIPTSYMVKHNNRWKRVYCAIWSNSGVCYIEQNRKPVATVDIY
jgi:exonuclease III